MPPYENGWQESYSQMYTLVTNNKCAAECRLKRTEQKNGTNSNKLKQKTTLKMPNKHLLYY